MRYMPYRVSDLPFFLANPDLGKNLHADPDTNPGGIWGVKGKMIFFLVIFTFQMIVNSLKKNL